jgi:hypothetical protein
MSPAGGRSCAPRRAVPDGDHLLAAGRRRAHPTTLRNRGEPAGFAKVAGPALAAAMRRANRTDPAVLKDRLER